MSISNFSEELLDLRGVKITNIKQLDGLTEIYLEHKSRADKCPHCGTYCGAIHDYREQRIKDIPAFGKEVVLVLRKRRLHCHHCGHHFQQKVDFLPKYHRMTSRLILYTITLLSDVRSFSSVARELNLSVTTVIRIFDLLQYPKPNILPRTLAIDEFKGNTGGQKFNCIITDPENHQVLDIIERRYGYRNFRRFRNRILHIFSHQRAA